MDRQQEIGTGDLNLRSPVPISCCCSINKINVCRHKIIECFPAEYVQIICSEEIIVVIIIGRSHFNIRGKADAHANFCGKIQGYLIEQWMLEKVVLLEYLYGRKQIARC